MSSSSSYKTLLVLFILSLAFLSACTEKQTNTIGFMSALSGDAASWGQESLQGAEFAVEQINEAGGNFQLEIQDSQCDPKAAVAAYNQLVHQKGISIITGQACSSVLLAIAPLAEEDGVVLLGSGTSNPHISEAGEYIFRVYVSDAYEGKEDARFMKDLGKSSTGLLVLNNDYGRGLEDAFISEFERLGGGVTGVEHFEQNTKDVRTQVLKIKETKPEAIVIYSNPGELPTVLKQTRQLFGKEIVILVNGPVLETEGVLEATEGQAEGIVYTTPATEIDPEFKAAFSARYGKKMGFVEPYGYDSIKVLEPAIKKCGVSNTECVVKELEKTDLVGVSGHIMFDENGDISGQTFQRKIVRDNKFQIYGGE